jgi:hypothetical protein
VKSAKIFIEDRFFKSLLRNTRFKILSRILTDFSFSIIFLRKLIYRENVLSDDKGNNLISKILLFQIFFWADLIVFLPKFTIIRLSGKSIYLSDWFFSPFRYGRVIKIVRLLKYSKGTDFAILLYQSSLRSSTSEAKLILTVSLDLARKGNLSKADIKIINRRFSVSGIWIIRIFKIYSLISEIIFCWYLYSPIASKLYEIR